MYGLNSMNGRMSSFSVVFWSRIALTDSNIGVNIFKFYVNSVLGMAYSRLGSANLPKDSLGASESRFYILLA